METKDVTNLAKYQEVLRVQRQLLSLASIRRGYRPTDRKARDQMVSEHLSRIESLATYETNPDHLIHRSSFSGIVYSPSVASLNVLKPIQIKDLRLETHHTNRSLIVRCITPPFKAAGITTIVEDVAGKADRLSLYNQDPSRDYQQILPKGRILMIKEPYYKATGDGGYGIRVDHVTDIKWITLNDDALVPVQWLSRPDSVDKTAEMWKLEGNTDLNNGKAFLAIEKYERALQCTDDMEMTAAVRLNRSQARLMVGQYDAALQDCLVVLSTHPQMLKGLFRAGRALYQLQRFSESLFYLEMLIAENSNIKGAQEELRKVRQRLHESTTGSYNFKAMHEAVSFKSPLLDHATYVGPVEVRQTKFQGRGVFATRAIKAGELVLCEKAFSAVIVSERAPEALTTNIDINSNCISIGAHSSVVADTVCKLRDNPSFAPAFTNLYKGDYTPRKMNFVDGEPVVDTFLVEAIVNLNAFGLPLSSREYFLSRPSISKQRSSSSPSSSSTSSSNQDERQENPLKDPGHSSCGIWLFASNFNHSCLENARRSFIGNVMIIRAARNIQANEQLTISYVSPTTPYDERQETLSHWDFQCVCPLCVAQRTTPQSIMDERTINLRDLAIIHASSTAEKDQEWFVKAELILDELEKTYFPSSSSASSCSSSSFFEPRLTIWNPLLSLAFSYQSLTNPNNPTNTARLILRFLHALGFKSTLTPTHFEIHEWGLMIPHVVDALMLLASVLVLSDSSVFEDVRSMAMMAYEILVGERVSFGEAFDQRDLDDWAVGGVGKDVWMVGRERLRGMRDISQRVKTMGLGEA